MTTLPAVIQIRANLRSQCKYGENAYQSPAGLYATSNDDPLALHEFKHVDGTAPGFINQTDVDRMLETLSHIDQGFLVNYGKPCCAAVGVKHGNPCGAAVGVDSKAFVLDMMIRGDVDAVFGGFIMTNFEIDDELAAVLHEALNGKVLDGIVAPSITPGAIAVLRRKTDRCRFIVNPALRPGEVFLNKGLRFRHVRGGTLVQPNYTFIPNFANGNIKKHSPATGRQEEDMLLAWAVGSTSNSNTITLSNKCMLIGNGVGQQDRRGAAKLAIERAKTAGHDVKGAVAYSDSFFPFPDGLETLIDAGVSAVFTSEAGIKFPEIVETARKAGIGFYTIPDNEGRGFFGH